MSGPVKERPLVVDPVVARARAFLASVGEMLAEKNARYGNSAADPLRIFSRSSAEEQILVRIDDKLSRIARGLGVEDEDVVRDLVGYLALLVAVRGEKAKAESSHDWGRE